MGCPVTRCTCEVQGTHSFAVMSFEQRQTLESLDVPNMDSRVSAHLDAQTANQKHCPFESDAVL